MSDPTAPPSSPSGAPTAPTAPNGRAAELSLVTTAAPPAESRTGDGSRPIAVAASGSGLPSRAQLALARASLGELERALVRGATPELDALIGWEFRGINATPPGVPPIARLAGVQKFVKGMFRAEDGRARGYNCPVVQNALDGRWQPRPVGGEPRRFGFFRIAPVDPTARDNRYLHALLLDYGKGGNPAWDPSRSLRDYLVQVDPGNPDLFLGKAYAAVGPARVPLGFFVLERWREAPPVAPARESGP